MCGSLLNNHAKRKVKRNAKSPAGAPPCAEYELLRGLVPYMGRRSWRYPLGIADDAALRTGAERLLFTADTLTEGTHFDFRFMNHREVGYRAMVANLSDCAAMGVRPEAALVQLVFVPTRDVRGRIVEVYRGLSRACDEWGFPVVGGDLAGGKQWTIAITMIGRATEGARILRRSGAKPGDGVWVTGAPGECAAGLAALKKWGRKRVPGSWRSLVRAFVEPRPRIETGRALAADRTVHAGIDVSDGLAKECRVLAHESGLGLVVERDALPRGTTMIQLGLHLGVEWTDWVLHGGEDYELLFTASTRFDPRALSSRNGVKVTRIGRVAPRGEGVVLENEKGSHVKLSGGWDHFGKSGPKSAHS